MAELVKKVKFITKYSDWVAVNVNAAYKDLILSTKVEFFKEYMCPAPPPRAGCNSRSVFVCGI